MEFTEPHHPNKESHSHHDFSPLDWKDFFNEKRSVTVGDDQFNVYLKGNSGTAFLLLHGGGYTGLTWSCFTEELSAKIECQVIAMDLRAHGETKTTNDEDLSTESLTQDVAGVYAKIFEHSSERPPLVVIGHSLGGALAVHLINANLVPNVVAMAVIDVVEGTAMASLSLVTHYLTTRPQTFPSCERAIRWCFESGTTRNLRSARISMPSQLKPIEGKETLRWRINLAKTQPHWAGWFSNLSKKFLECRPAKVLILANTDRLDKELMIGQMKGQFQYEVIANSGHAVQEDSPARVAEIFVTLVNRYKPIFKSIKV
ncbi:Protein phosphatase methylesterase-1 [Aphelenchoides bicaudatus]|nr:Protein phosphatase methylesterase-1 [Aphelenchoides bicaudatus]